MYSDISFIFKEVALVLLGAWLIVPKVLRHFLVVILIPAHMSIFTLTLIFCPTGIIFSVLLSYSVGGIIFSILLAVYYFEEYADSRLEEWYRRN